MLPKEMAENLHACGVLKCIQKSLTAVSRRQNKNVKLFFKEIGMLGGHMLSVSWYYIKPRAWPQACSLREVNKQWWLGWVRDWGGVGSQMREDRGWVQVSFDERCVTAFEVIKCASRALQQMHVTASRLSYGGARWRRDVTVTFYVMTADC